MKSRGWSKIQPLFLLWGKSAHAMPHRFDKVLKKFLRLNRAVGQIYGFWAAAAGVASMNCGSRASLLRMKESTVIRFTPKIFAIFVLGTFFWTRVLIVSSWPDSLTWLDLRHLGRPRTTPSARLRAKASFVRWLMRLRSISADRPKANANTLL